MRVAILLDRYLPVIGGAQLNVHLLARELTARGFHATVLARRSQPGMLGREILDGVTIRRVGRGPCRQISKALTLVEVVAHLVGHRKRYDVVLSVPLGYVSDLLPAYFAWRLTGTPYVVRTANADDFDTMLDDSRSARLRRFAVPRALWRRALNAAAATVVQSEAIAARARRHGVPRVEIIPNGVDTGRFTAPTPDERNTLRRVLGLPVDRVVVVTVGRYDTRKNFLAVIQAAEEIERRLPRHLYVVVVGAAEWRQSESSERALKAYVGERRISFVQFADNVTRPETYLRAADLFVLATVHEEGMPNAVLEAMACGLPVVCSALPQIRDMLPRDWRFLTTPGDVTELAGHIATLSRNPALRDALGAVVGAHTRERYASARVAARFGELLAGLRAGGRGSARRAELPT